MAFRTDDKGGGGCRWTAHGGDNTSTRWSNNTDTRSKVYGYAELDTHMGSVFLQTFQPAEVDYSGNHKFRWGTRNVYKVSLKSSWTEVQTLIFQFFRPRSPRCEPRKATNDLVSDMKSGWHKDTIPKSQCAVWSYLPSFCDCFQNKQQ